MPQLLKFSLVALILILASNIHAQDAAKGLELYNSGGYLKARSELKPLLENSVPESSELVSAYFLTYQNTGEYSEGIKSADAFLEKYPENPYILNAKAKLHIEIGEYVLADSLFSEVRLQDSGNWENLFDLANLMSLTGDNYQATSLYQKIYIEYTNGSFRTPKLLSIAGISAAKIGKFHEANEAFRTANKLDPKNTEVLYQWAELFRSKYNEADAGRTYNEALEINPNFSDLYTGLSHIAGGFAVMEKFAQTALEKNPSNVKAMGVIAGLLIIDSKYDEARDISQTALSINPKAMLSLANLASIHLLIDDSVSYDALKLRVLEFNPYPAKFYMAIAENLVYRFRYEDAVTMSYSAVSADRNSAETYTALGINLLRLGEFYDAERYLKYGFEQDPFNLFAGNSLNLIDEYELFETLESENFTLLINKKEADILGSRILKYAEETFTKMLPRYPYTPSGKIRLEAYNDKDDFAVRLSGLPGAPLLGVCFGEVLAFTTPEAQNNTPYNWARTLWHEIAHVMALGASDHRVPRWFTEGLSVHEELKAKPQWGREMDLELLQAYNQDLLLPLKNFNQGFTRPQYPMQIILSYYQASKIIGIIEEEYGFGAIAGLLEEFKKKNDLETSFQNVLGVETSVIDKKLKDGLEKVNKGLGNVLNGMPDMLGTEMPSHSFLEKMTIKTESKFLSLLRSANSKVGDDPETAEKEFKEALEMYPNFIQSGNPYQGLAHIYEEKKDTEKYKEIVERFLKVTEYGSQHAIALAELYEKESQPEKALEFYERSLENTPYNLDTYLRIAEINEAKEDFAAAAEARKSILSLKPRNKANAHYLLALDLVKSNNVKGARTQVLKSLEIAPYFREAQKLLLEIRTKLKK